MSDLPFRLFKNSKLDLSGTTTRAFGSPWYLSDIYFIKSRVKGAKVLYGGSVNSKNINNLKNIDNIDGFLIGGASQNSNNLIDIIKKTYN